MSLVSICIPTYNQTKYLRKVLDSVFEQTFSDYEVIVSDDSTTHDVKKLIDEYISRGYTIQYFHHIPALGSPENWNFAMSQAQGEYIKILHHDDWFVSDSSLQDFVNLALQSNAEFVFSGAIIEKTSGYTRTHSITQSEFQQIKKNPKYLFLANIIGAPSAVMFKKNKFTFNPHLIWLVDIEFYYRYLKENSNINFTSKALVVTFDDDSRITNSCVNNKFIEIPEHLYLMHIHTIFNYQALNVIINLCTRLQVNTFAQIRECGYKGDINWRLRILFVLKMNIVYNTYAKIRRKISYI